MNTQIEATVQMDVQTVCRQANVKVFPGYTGLGSAPLWASISHHNSQEAVVWRPEASSTRSWREASIFVGSVPSTFRIRLHSERSEGRRGDVAVDQLEFLDCAMPRETLESLPSAHQSADRH